MLMIGYVDELGLKSSWESLLHRFGIEPSPGEKIFFELVTAYCSSGRFYHTLGHVQHVLETIEGMRAIAKNFPAIQLAAWFHDAIYDPTAKDNEDKSAEYAAAALTELEIPGATIEAVTKMILTTKHHQAPADDSDSHILLDADLAILGTDELDYQVYAKGIRLEYKWLSDEEYGKGRKRVLEKFLRQKRIYFTSLLFAELEEKARQNMQAEIVALSVEG